MAMASVAGLLPVPVSSSYAAAKHGLRGFFSSMAAEASAGAAAGASPVSITLVCPGPVVSEGSGAALVPAGDESTTFADQGHTVDDSGKMPTAECARLALAATAAGIQEAWVSTQPVLAFLYIQWLCPALAQWLAARVAAVRMANLSEARPKLNAGLGRAVLAALCSPSAALRGFWAALNCGCVVCTGRGVRRAACCCCCCPGCGLVSAAARVCCCASGRPKRD